MGYIETLATERRARLIRLGRGPIVIPPPWKGMDDTPFWPFMWMGDLVFGEIRPEVGYLTIRAIQERVSSHFGLTISQLLSLDRGNRICRPRQLAIYLARLHTKHSTNELGRRFGDRDHSTIINAVKRITARLLHDEALALDLRAIEDSLGVGHA